MQCLVQNKILSQGKKIKKKKKKEKEGGKKKQEKRRSIKNKLASLLQIS